MLAAPLDWPYGYYQAMRLVVCACSGFLAWKVVEEKGRLDLVAICLIGLALLYNPIFRIHLAKETWTPINIVTAVALVILWFVQRRSAERASEGEG